MPHLKEKRLTKFCWRSYNQICRQPRSFPAHIIDTVTPSQVRVESLHACRIGWSPDHTFYVPTYFLQHNQIGSHAASPLVAGAHPGGDQHALSRALARRARELGRRHSTNTARSLPSRSSTRQVRTLMPSNFA